MLNTVQLMRHKLSPKLWLPISYFTFFSAWGILIPYWGKWLSGLGYNQQEIGNMIAVSLIARSLGSLIIPLALKQSSQLIPGLRVLSILCVSLISLFFIPMNWVLLLLLMIAYNFVMSPCIPMGDSLAAAWQKQNVFEYGKVRLWGSIGFIFASILVGILLDLFDYHAIIICLFVTHISFLISTFLKADISFTKKAKEESNSTEANAHDEDKSYSLKEITQFFLQPTLFFIMLAVMLIQGSHAAYYNFAALFWSNFGYSDTLIGIFISFAVFVEVLFFAYGNRIVSQWSMRNLFLCCGIFTILRWILMANFSSLPMILLMQSFHAFTYVMGHLAMMRFISQFKNQQIIYLQAAYATMASGVGLALFSSLSGTLLESIGANTFYVMAVIALVGLVLIPRRLNAN